MIGTIEKMTFSTKPGETELTKYYKTRAVHTKTALRKPALIESLFEAKPKIILYCPLITSISITRIIVITDTFWLTMAIGS